MTGANDASTSAVAAADGLLAPLITVDEAASEEEVFTLSEFSDTSAVSVVVSDAELPDTAQPEPQTSDQQTETVPQVASKSSDKLLTVPTSTVADEAEEEVIKKGGIAGAIAHTFVVSISRLCSLHGDFGLSNNNKWRWCMGVDSSNLQADSQPKSFGVV